MNSQVVGIGGNSTGLGLFTLKKIPRGTLVCAYAPTATIWEGKLNGDYVSETSFNNKVISVNGKEIFLNWGWEFIVMMEAFHFP